MKLINKIMLIGSLLAAGGCIEDKTNTAFMEVNRIKVTNLEASYARSIGDSLIIKPEWVNSVEEAKDEYAYVWFLSTSKSMYAADTLSREKDLKIVVNTLPGEYNLNYKVTSLRTGVSDLFKTTIRVDGVYSTGVLILSENDGFAQLNFLPAIGNLMTGVYEGVNNEKLGRNPKKVSFVKPDDKSDRYKEVYVLCQDEQGGVCLDPNSLKKRTGIRDAFFIPLTEPMVASMLYFKPVSGVLADYLLIGGKAYNRSCNTKDEIRFKSALLADKEGYSLAPWHLSSPSTAWFFDNKNHRFLVHKEANKGGLVPFVAEDATKFDPNQVNMELICGGFGKTGRPNARIFGIFKDIKSDGKHYMLDLNVGIGTNVMSINKKYELDDSKHMLSASCYEIPRHTYYSLLIFYAHDSQIYVHNVEEGVTVLLYDCNELVENSSMIVDCLEVASETDLRIGLRNRNLQGKQGGYALLKLKEIGGLGIDKEVPPVMKFGFCDKVVDFDAKF